MRIANGSNRIWILVSMVLLVGFIVYIILYPPTSKVKTDTVVATVNGVEIQKDELYKALLITDAEQTALQNLITTELIRQEGKKGGIVLTDADYEKDINSIKASFPSEDEFKLALTSYGMTLESLKKDMEPQVLLRKLLEPQVNIANTDIQTYYDTNLDSFKEPEQVKASHILVEKKEDAESILAELKNGGDFAKIAQEKSIDDESKVNGGDLGFFSKGMMVEAFDTAAFTLQLNTLSDLIQTESGYHIIKVAERKAERTATFDEKKEEIRETLVNEKLSELSNTFMQEKMSLAKIETFL